MSAVLAQSQVETSVLTAAHSQLHLGGEPSPALTFAGALRAGDEAIHQAYTSGVGAATLVRSRVTLVDDLIRRAWRQWVSAEADDVALVAVGGYGRGELLPHSDVDLLVLLGAEAGETYTAAIENLFTLLWDMGLDLGHSVRTPAQCAQQAAADVTIATNLMETRLLDGSPALYEEMRAATSPRRIWPPREFFAAKLEEQIQRHHKFHDTAYKLEPNIKESPGGLRDIQMIGWVAKRHFDAETLHELVLHGFLTEDEYRTLNEGQQLLWKIRYLLHRLARRKEDRLLLDYQRELAQEFGYLDNTNNLAVEQFMQLYYRTVMELERLNEMLLQLFQEELLLADESAEPVVINKRYQIRKGYLEVRDENVFKNFPPALLEIFLVISQHPEIRGLRANTIRLIRSHRYLINGNFRNDLIARNLFMEILRQPQGLTHQLRRMSRYGVLAAYLPVFERIVGRMQYDLFHIYTVDEHTLMVVRNLRRFDIPKHADELPYCNEIMLTLPRKELLYIAALFHDIAKGRGGDHSELGAEDAYQFCQEHGLKSGDSRLVEWLVRNHLLMSITAQRRDTNDPDVVHQFATQVGSLETLNYLFLLTIADIRATNPDLWNSWKENLLRDLYRKTERALRRGLHNAIDKDDRIQLIKENAEQLLRGDDLPWAAVESLWRGCGDDYFVRHTSDEVAWHTRGILTQAVPGEPLVLVRRQGERGSTEVFLFIKDHDNLFALVTAVMDRLGLDIVDARIITSDAGAALDTFLVLDASGEPITDIERENSIRDALVAALKRPDTLPSIPKRQTPRKLRNFDIPVTIVFTNQADQAMTSLEISACDRPGLLARIGRSFLESNIRVHNARIATIGERVDDVFFITDQEDRPLTDEHQREKLSASLRNALEN